MVVNPSSSLQLGTLLYKKLKGATDLNFHIEMASLTVLEQGMIYDMHLHGLCGKDAWWMENDTSLTTLLPLNITSILTTVQPTGKHGKVFFSWYDYTLFTVMLAISGMIGIYFGCFGNKQNTAKEYLMGGKEDEGDSHSHLSSCKVDINRSHTSGITLLALPADVYVYGATYWLGSIAMAILVVITIFVYLPVFYNLHLTSTYEYLGLRFDKRTRKCSSFLFCLIVGCVFTNRYLHTSAGFLCSKPSSEKCMTQMHAEVKANSQLETADITSGINVHVITPVVCGVCIFYTTLGGLKALVWSDTLQFSITVGAMATICWLGVKATGGVANVWQKSVEGKRLDIFDFAFDPTKRESFWAVVVGLTIHWTAYTSVNQGCTQKFLSVSTMRESKWAVASYCFGMILMKTLSVLSGLVMFARYSDCDPFTTKLVNKNDELLPYYVMDVAGGIPGLSGIFIAGVFCASLSALSANLNCLSGTIYEDFLKGRLEKKGKVKNPGLILKSIVVITGVISTLMVYVAENLGSLLSLSIGLGSVAHGPLLALFTLGILFPRANGKGAFYGAVVSVLCMGTIITTANYYKSQNLLRYPTRPVSVDGCSFPVNSTIAATLHANTLDGASEVPAIFRVSFYWYTTMGATIGIVVGLILLSPVIHPFLSEEHKKADAEYCSVKEALNKVTTEAESAKDMEERMRKASYISDIIDD
ncbi:hypothetical protein NQ318_006075 [Aromia moschata]|uniref:Uncharacterized protein n=1 Tax=Aromia moschata TaxID=1265417 RepID=A0AAV8Z267_9CUCU|nr:hypothetical protein NQ318_006075 [Aromia moschata]